MTSLRAERKAREQALQDDPDTVRWMCEAIERAEDLTAWCRGHDVSYSRMVAWIEADPGRAVAIDNAYKARAALAAGAVEAMSRRLLDADANTEHPWLPRKTRDSGELDDKGEPIRVGVELDPRAARVAMAGLQWTAEKHHREKFGKVTEHKHSHTVQFEHLAAMRAFNGRSVPGVAGVPADADGVPLAVLERMQSGAPRVDPVSQDSPLVPTGSPNHSPFAGSGTAHIREPLTLDGEAHEIAAPTNEHNAINELRASDLAGCLSLRRRLTRV